ncbi:MAG: hypothetical protein ACFNM7_08665 [Prevotella conceptionensis]
MASKQTFARIDFLGQGGRLVSKKGTFNVKFITEKLTAIDELTDEQVKKKTSG